MSALIDLNAECEVRVEARMANRPGCSASGADSGDQLRVREVGGPTPGWQTGASNATIVDIITQQGGQVLVEGFANRADEIITYEVFFESGNCPFCILLPVELVRFDAFLDGFTVQIDWITATENNNFGFFIEASRDNERFEVLSFISGKGNSLQESRYSTAVDLPEDGAWYLRLAQQDHNGQRSYSPTVFLEVRSEAVIDFQANARGLEVLNRSGVDHEVRIEVFRPDGRMQESHETRLASGGRVQVALEAGLSIVVVHLGGRVYSHKIVRSHH